MGNVLYINKPIGMSSFDVCYKLRRVLNTKKIGHTGTLDPNASGVMIILYNNATKANQFLTTDSKEYIATVKLGIQTDTLDITGNIIETRDCNMPIETDLRNCLNSFLGFSKQEVPLTSAVKVNGKRLYKYQLENKEVELPVRDINVFEIELLEINEKSFTFKTKVSSGTYIRALVRDILVKLDLVGTLAQLTRSKVDDIDIAECDNLNDVLNGKYHSHDLIDVLSKKYKVIEIDCKEDIINGKTIVLNEDDEKLLLVHQNQLLAIYQKDNNVYRCLRGLL